MSDTLNVSIDLSGKLSMINRRIEEVLVTDNTDLTEMSLYNIKGGGKRLRPLIVLLAFEMNTDRDISNALDLAVAYELMHSASLIHDDIIDESDERRGQLALHRKYNVQDAIVTGDFLFSVAYRLGAKYGREVSDTVALAARKLAEGQITESKNLGNLSITESIYMNIISNKTAYFFGAGARSATIAAEADLETQKNMFKFAYNIGMAFQITDDILDIVGKEEVIGKPTFMDFKHSALTLPMIYALKNSQSHETENLKNVIRGNRTDKESINAAKNYLLTCGAVDKALELAKHYIDEGIEAMRYARNSPNLQTLFEIAYSIISRIRI